MTDKLDNLPKDFILDFTNILLENAEFLHNFMSNIENNKSKCFDLPFYMSKNYGFSTQLRISNRDIFISIEKLQVNNSERV